VQLTIAEAEEGFKRGVPAADTGQPVSCNVLLMLIATRFGSASGSIPRWLPSYTDSLHLYLPAA